jgi:uncharacterized Zn finger protein
MLVDLLNKDVLVELAGERAFERGADYFADGHVVGIKEENAAITARVRGTYYYRVKLWAEDEELNSECNCPVGQDGVFCKHCVAAGLAWLERRKQKGGATRRQTKRDVTDEEIRAHLMGQDKSSLVELVMNHAEWDSDFRNRLVLATAQRGWKAPDLAAFRAAIDKAIRQRSFVDYGRMPEYARGIEAAVNSLGDLLKRGHTNEVRGLTERALKQMESAMNYVDDSDGFMGGILDQLQELHLSACRAAKPDPCALAKFLFEWEIASRWEIFLGASETYARVLGKAGLAEYRKLAEAK